MTNQLNDVADVIAAIGMHDEPELMFRGQSRDWPLLPGIGRFPVWNFASNWRDFHESVIDDFMRHGAPFFKDVPATDVEKWVYAQHHGLPTRLLDTALNPLKAMHFAVSDPREDEQDGVFWVIAYQGWRQDLDDQYREFWDQEVTAFLPAQIHPRLTAQEGAFMCYPLPETSEPLSPLDQLPPHANESDIECHKYIIPANSKRKMRYEISRLGARHSLLFPDLDGVAREITLGMFARYEE